MIQLTTRTIQIATARHFEIKASDLRGKKRPWHISRPRQIAMYLARKHNRSSFTEIAYRFGGKHHTTVIYAYHKIERLLNSDSVLGREVGYHVRNILKIAQGMQNEGGGDT